MGLALHRRFARRQDLGLAPRDFARLARLDSPQRIQAFVNAIPIKHELDGETAYSVQSVLRHGCAHCIEGAWVAACALSYFHEYSDKRGRRTLQSYSGASTCGGPLHHPRGG